MSGRKWRRSIGSIFGGKLTVPQQTNMVWLNLKSMGIDEVGREETGRRYGLQIHSCTIVSLDPDQ